MIRAALEFIAIAAFLFMLAVVCAGLASAQQQCRSVCTSLYAGNMSCRTVCDQPFIVQPQPPPQPPPVNPFGFTPPPVTGYPAPAFPKW